MAWADTPERAKPSKAEEKAYVPAAWLSEKENASLKGVTTTNGSVVHLQFTGFLGVEGQGVGMRLLSLALRRYSAATLFIVRYGNQVFNHPYTEDRWTYNRKRQTLMYHARDADQPWPHQATIYKITDAVLLITARNKGGLGDVVEDGATRKP